MRGVTQLHIKQGNILNDVLCAVQTDLISHIVGRGQRVTGRRGGGVRDCRLDFLPLFIGNSDLYLMGGIPSADGDGISLTDNRLAGEVGGLYFRFKNTFVPQFTNDNRRNGIFFKIAPAVFRTACGYGFGGKEVVCVRLPPQGEWSPVSTPQGGVSSSYSGEGTESSA